MQRTFSPEALARREARKAETKARNEAKRAALEAEKLAAREAQREAWVAAQQKQRDDFKASLSEADWNDLQEALSRPTTETLPCGFVRTTDEWLHSVKQQFDNRGWLSPAQLKPLLYKVQKRREYAEKAEAWPTINAGDKVKVACTVVGATQERGDYGFFYKIRLLTQYGRSCNIKTGRAEWFQHAKAKQAEGKKVFITATVKWVAPDAGGPFVLTSRGARFGDLL